jgi:hypothetical protein
MAKVRMQWKASKESVAKLSQKDREFVEYKSATDILRKVYISEGILGWYNGMTAQILKAVFSQAVVFTIKEKLSLYTIAMLTALKKVHENKQK